MKNISLSTTMILFLLGLMACKEDTISPLQKIEVEIDKAFTVDGLTQLSFSSFNEIDLKIEIRDFSEHLVDGLVSKRTYVDVDIIDNMRTSFQIETGYEDRCHTQSTGGNCNELRVEMQDQVYFLRFEEVYWSDVKENKEGVEFIEVDSARLMVERE